MESVYLTGALFFIVATAFGYFKEGWSVRSALFGIATAATFAIAGAQQSISTGLFGSVLAAIMLSNVIPEQLKRYRPKK